MSLNNKTIEILSVNAVKDSIVTSDFLEPSIAENDKEPSWDGFVYIYEDKLKEKSKLRGRMPIQVKGKVFEDHSKKEISYSMLVSDLKNYLNDGGCILFVVYIGSEGLTKKIYYCELTPVKLIHLFSNINNQTNKTVKLKEFPLENNSKETIFFNCLQNCQKQKSFSNNKLFTLEELNNEGNIEEFIIPFSGVGVSNPEDLLLNNEVYLYAKVKGSPIPHPIEGLLKNIETQKYINEEINIGDEIFYSHYTINDNSNERILCLGESFRMNFNKKTNICKINYKNSNKIRMLAKDLNFMISYIEKGYFEIKDIKVPFYPDKASIEKFNIEYQKRNLEYAKKVVQLLDMFHCYEDIDINLLNKEDWINLSKLVEAFIDRKPVEGLNKDLPHICYIKIGALKFIVNIQRNDKVGSYNILDFFNIDLNNDIKYINKEGEILKTSKFIILSEKDLLTISNIDFDKLLPSFQQMEYNRETFTIANDFLLIILKAFDKAKGKRKDQLSKTCMDFSKWISEASNNDLDYDVQKINYLQTIKRFRNLNDIEINELEEIINSKNPSQECIVGAYLLLEQQKAAEIQFKNLSIEQQNEFKKLPIYYFWKTNK